MLFSTIKMYQRSGNYQCKIIHNGRKVESGWHKNAANAYAEAESRLVYAPGYVQRVT